MANTIKLRPSDKDALEQIRILLEGLPDPVPTIKQLVRKSGLNADKLKKGFKLLYGSPPYHYYMHFRLDKAIKLLGETELSVSEIAWELGYKDASNFCAGFKNATGMTPLQRRELAVGFVNPLRQMINKQFAEKGVGDG